MARGDAYQLQGQDGGIVLTGTGSWASTAGRTGRWIQVIEDAVFDSITSNLAGADSNLTSITITAGQGIGGETTGLTLASGTVIIYYREG